jgi:hypothetical protein
MSLVPQLLSPALPSELLSYVLNHHMYPSTLIICSGRSNFMTALQEDIEVYDNIERSPLAEGAATEDSGFVQSAAQAGPKANQEHTTFYIKRYLNRQFHAIFGPSTFLL